MNSLSNLLTVFVRALDAAIWCGTFGVFGDGERHKGRAIGGAEAVLEGEHKAKERRRNSAESKAARKAAALISENEGLYAVGGGEGGGAPE